MLILAVILRVFWRRVHVCIFITMHLLCSITKKVPYLIHKYLCNFNTEPHNINNWTSTESYCSCCTVLPNCSNTNWSHCVLTVCSQLSVPFCTAIRNHKAAQYAINRQLKSRHLQFSSLHSVWFVSVRSVAASSSVTEFAFRAASCTVSTSVHELYCTAMFSRTSLHIQYSYTVLYRHVQLCFTIITV